MSRGCGLSDSPRINRALDHPDVDVRRVTGVMSLHALHGSRAANFQLGDEQIYPVFPCALCGKDFVFMPPRETKNRRRRHLR